MKLIIEIPEDVYTRLFDNGIQDNEIAVDDICEMARALRLGKPLPKGHERKFEEIMVEYPPADLCTYPEYRGKPYFSIKYEEKGKHIIGFGTYKPEVFSRYLREYFIEADKENKMTYVASEQQVIERGEKVPIQKTGHWIRWYERKETEQYIDNIPHCKCSECGKEYDPHSSQFIKYCNECGAKMFEPQESEVRDDR